MDKKTWSYQELPGYQLVRPENDIISHTHTRQCPCNPLIKTIGFECDTAEHYEFDHPPKLAVVTQIIHRALDGREQVKEIKED